MLAEAEIKIINNKVVKLLDRVSEYKEIRDSIINLDITLKMVVLHLLEKPSEIDIKSVIKSLEESVERLNKINSDFDNFVGNLDEHIIKGGNL